MAEQQSMAVLEEAIDIVEDQIEVIEKSAGLVKRIIWNHKTHISVAFLVGAGVGTAITYKLTKDKLTARYEELLEEEVQKTKEHYSRKEMTGDYADPVTAAKVLIPEEERERLVVDGVKAMQDYRSESPAVEPETAAEAEELIREEIKQSKKRNIFENSVEEFHWDEEIAYRESLSDADPYVITFEEYHEDEENEESQLTYFQGDGVLADEQSTALTDDQEDALIGDGNLRFGYGSKDGNIVYIRNPRVGMNMEIVRSEGRYDVEVFGVEAPETELKHSGRRGRKFKESFE